MVEKACPEHAFKNNDCSDLTIMLLSQKPIRAFVRGFVHMHRVHMHSVHMQSLLL